MTGDFIVQSGPGSVGKQYHSGSGDNVAGGKLVHGPQSPEAAMDTLLTAVATLRRHLDDSDRADVDSAVRRLDPDAPVAELREPLGKIAGIAALLGEVGAPVISAIKELLNSLSG